jgi:beta-lactamase class A
MTTRETSWPAVQAIIDGLPDPADISVSVRHDGAAGSFTHLGDMVTTAASTIKVLILVTLAQAADVERIDLGHPVAVKPDQRAGGSGILNELETPVELSLADHAHLMIAISDNTSSNVLIDAVGMEAIAVTATGLGLTGTALQRRFLGRLPDPGTPENLTTANDLTTLLMAIASQTAASPERCAWMEARLAGQHYLNRLPRFLPSGIRFGGKSGSLEGFDHDCGLFSGPGGRMAVAVLHRRVRDPYAADVVIGRIGAAAIADARLDRVPV